MVFRSLFNYNWKTAAQTQKFKFPVIFYFIWQPALFEMILRANTLMYYTQGFLPPKSFQIKEIIGEWNLEIICFWLKNCSNTIFLTLKPKKETLGIILKIVKKNFGWRHCCQICKQST